MSQKPIYVLNGPNLNLLGKREPEIYGRDTLKDVEALCSARAEALSLAIDFRQTNVEGELISWIQEADKSGAGVILNAAAYTHTSVGLYDALLAVDVPVIEVHLSNPYKRETFRHKSFVSPAASGVICGFGAKGYELALEAMADLLSGKAK
jgi:3-dehydroquinate dehydratase-2